VKLASAIRRSNHSTSVLALVASVPLACLAQTTAMPDWQKAAGGKQEFDAVSVRENKSGEAPYSNFPLNPGSQFDAKGGLLVAKDMPLLQFIVFAYKPDMFQIQEFRAKLPEWARATRYDIEARVEGNPTKDDIRLMMQSLLAERFHMVVHRETRNAPVFAIVLARPEKTGPRLTPHPEDDQTCAKTVFPPTLGGAYPIACGASGQIAPETPGDFAAVGYNLTMGAVATALGGADDVIDRRVIDQTGLTGKFDFRIEFFPEPNLTASPDAAADAAPVGPSFAEALKSQLGLKLVEQKRPTEVLVIDHIEEKPTDN
jgi:uncharacterized protein (TIGR03435 family)